VHEIFQIVEAFEDIEIVVNRTYVEAGLDPGLRVRSRIVTFRGNTPSSAVVGDE
jgi:hypothetical protein